MKNTIANNVKGAFDKKNYEEVKAILKSENARNLNREEKEYVKDYLENFSYEIRICDMCNDFMVEGIVICGGDEYYCTEECLYKEIDEEEWLKLTAYLTEENERTEKQEEWYEEYGDTDCYWTDWI